MITKLVEPPEIDPVTNAVEHCELMIEEAIARLIAARDGKPIHLSCLGEDYDEGYEHGRKDACRVILICLRGREHITSDDVRRSTTEKGE